MLIPEEYSRACAIIDLDAVIHNMEQMRQGLKPDTKMFAVIKTDAYGHGCIPIAHTLEEKEYVYGFAVATAEEAFLLRKNGISKPVLVLGYTFPYAYERMVEENVIATVFRMDSLEAMQKASEKVGKAFQVHVKVDTGMGRIGVRPDADGVEFIQKLKSYAGLQVQGIFTHFSRSDEKNKTSALEQLQMFQSFIQLAETELGYSIPVKHCANSAAILEMPETQMDVVRAGISMYGLMPSDEMREGNVTLKPVFSLYSHIVHIKELKKGDSVSYGGTFVAKDDMLVATVPIGYGDGYPRGLSNKGWVLVRGKKAPILGRVCMDQLMVDVTGIKDVLIHDLVTLLGTDGEEALGAEQVGSMCGRFHYELLCDFGKRIPRVFVQNGKVVATKDYYME